MDLGIYKEKVNSKKEINNRGISRPYTQAWEDLKWTAHYY